MTLQLMHLSSIMIGNVLCYQEYTLLESNLASTRNDLGNIRHVISLIDLSSVTR